MKKFAIFLLSFPLVWACQVSSTIDVGMVVSSTGQYSPLLITARNGVILAAEELNAQGGLQFNLHIMDDESSKEVGKSRLQEMIQEGIDLFILSVTSGSYAEMEALINANDLLAISPTVSSDVFKGKDDNFIRMTTDVSGYALILARYAEEAGSEHTLIVYDSNNLQYAQQMIKNFQSTLVETGSDMTLSVLAFDSTQEVDYSQVGESIALNKPDTLFLVASPFDSALLSQAVARQDFLKLYSPWSISEELVQNGGRTVEGGIFLLAEGFTEGDSPSMQAFKERYKKRFGQEATYQSPINYDALLLLRDLIAKTGDPSPQKLKQALLEQSKFQGIDNQYIFDAFGDSSHSLALHTIQDGEIRLLD